MKQRTSVLLLICGFAWMQACNKNVDGSSANSNVPITNAEATLIKNWLNVQKSMSKDSSSLSRIIGSLDWTASDKAVFEHHTQLIAIPVKQEVSLRQLARLVKSDKSTASYLVILLDSLGQIKQSTIGQILPQQSMSSVRASVFIGSILADKNITYNGKFAMMSLDRNILYQFTYEDNKRTALSALQPLSPSQSAQVKTNGRLDVSDVMVQTNGNDSKVGQGIICTEWYWVTTYSDGSEIWSYMYTTCDDAPCNSTSIKPDGNLGQIKVNCGGGANDGGEENTRTVTVSISANPNISYDPYFLIYGNCLAVRESGVLTTVNMLGSYFSAVRPSYSYNQTGKTNYKNTAGGATYGFTGDLTVSSSETYTVGVTKAFSLTQLFP